jgi:hypothetical protein
MISIFQLQKLSLKDPQFVADADYGVISVELGDYSPSSDSDVFNNSEFGKLLESNKLNIPDPRFLSNDSEQLYMLFVLVGGEAFALSLQVIWPYSNKLLTCFKRIYNCRLSRGRGLAERNLGIYWITFHRPVNVKPDFSDSTIQACCILHNYIRKNDCMQLAEILCKCRIDSTQPAEKMGQR